MNDFDFRYDSYGFGNATIKMSAGAQEVVFNASYIGSNPLDDLLQALADMVYEEYDHCLLRWMSEPGILRFRVDVVDGAEAHLLVETFDGDVDYLAVKDAQWQRQLETDIPLALLSEVVVKEAERNLRLHGLVGFSEDWCNHTNVFPISAYLRLKGVGYKFDDKDLKKSSLEEELATLSALL